MRRYCASPAVDKKMNGYLEKIKDIIVSEIDPVSIILFGGFGKGEGSFWKGEPFNDIDLYVVTKKRLSDHALEELGIKASNAIGKGGLEFMERAGETYDSKRFFHVDIRCLQYSKLSKLMNTTRTYEIKNSSQIIYGEDIRGRINITEKELPISEGFRHMINKSSHLLLCMDRRRLSGNFRKDEDKIVVYLTLKAILGCCETLLLSYNRFAPTYSTRNTLFKKLLGRKYPGLAREIDQATRLKLNLDFKKEDPIEFWFRGRQCLYKTLKIISNRHLGITAKDTKPFLRKVYKKLPYIYFNPYTRLGRLSFPAQYALNIVYARKTRHWKSLLKWRDVGIRIMMPAFLLLFAIDRDGSASDKNLLAEASQYIKYMAPVKARDWGSLRDSLLYAYGRYYTQKLI